MDEVLMARSEEKMVGLETEEEQTKKMVQWEKFLPRVVLRVLLVEADDSTRHIIAALLRKCSYSVVAVPDGLKAWETLERKATDIDLILTEVELPSVSGFALLTLIMEHDICKNIPVIMMSSHDSVSMALNCILKGAADFLIKPVRRNELRNLWQHVWRRHEINRQPQNLTYPQKSLVTTSENNAASNHSSGSVASTQKNNRCSEKGSEAQSACTSPFLEAESACVQNMQGAFHPKSSSTLSNIETVQHQDLAKLGKESVKHNSETGDLGQEQGLNSAEKENEVQVLRVDLSRGNPDMNTVIHGCNSELAEPSRGAIDLIATFRNRPEKYDESCSLSGGGTKKFDFDPRLELSLRRDFPGSSCKQTTDEMQALNHSEASAFSWYSGCKFPSASIGSAKVSSTKLNSHKSSKISGNSVDTPHQYGGANYRQENMTTLSICQSGQVELQSPNSQLGPFPATGVTSDNNSIGYGNIFPSMFYTQSVVHSTWSPKPICPNESSPFLTSNSFQSNPESHNSEQHHHCSDDATYTSLERNVYGKRNLDPARQDSSAVDQSTSNSLCHDTLHHNDDNNTSAYRSTGRIGGNATSAAVVESNPKSFGNSACHNHDEFKGTDSHRPSPREAALTKFRMKRKGRCYEKKVRYQSRKRLAEQRPRVKGQFVRQVHNNDHPVADADGGS